MRRLAGQKITHHNYLKYLNMICMAVNYYFVEKKFIHINFWILSIFLLIGQALYILNTTDLQLAVGCLGQLDTSQGATKHWTTGRPSGHCPAVGGKMKKIVLRGKNNQWYLVSWSSEEILTVLNCLFNQLTSSFFFVISRFTTYTSKYAVSKNFTS